MDGISVLELGLGDEELKLRPRAEVSSRMWTAYVSPPWYSERASRPNGMGKGLSLRTMDLECRLNYSGVNEEFHADIKH